MRALCINILKSYDVLSNNEYIIVINIKGIKNQVKDFRQKRKKFFDIKKGVQSITNKAENEHTDRAEPRDHRTEGNEGVDLELPPHRQHGLPRLRRASCSALWEMRHLS